MRYKRVLVKVSGGALAGKSGDAFDQFRLEHVADEILTLVNQGIEVAIVVGGGNIFRGRLAEMWGIDPVEADNIGVLGTVINSLMLRGVLKSKTNKEVRVMTSIPITSVAEPYIRLRATHHLDKGYIVIFAGGNGQPFVTTDYPAVQRALETHCDAIFAAKQGVNGVYTNDPKIDSTAKKYKTLNYNDVIKENIKVMDQSALILARDHRLPVHIFDFEQTNIMTLICQGKNKGTIVSDLATSFE
ncbi:UMP kinase [Sporolactobacillus laevolacticus]|uniref:UMP kinase n=1 Tax=Sporolactobacillus laevolacticus TaxID=33018 RepID=UPI0025B2ED94|nr:UMP kinase [Sporolactobacillus laevolacticus]MDN3956036.1 UMP kinase [Sporolactobacillus laevolacticus]